MNPVDATRKNPGIKTQYFAIPKPVTPQAWKCVQLQIPDHEQWLLQFRSMFRYYLGSWFNFERDEAKSGKSVAAVWRYVESTIKDCGGTSEETPDECCEPSQDIFDEFDADNIEDLYEKMSAALTPFIGQVVMGIAQPTSGNWLKCDGSAVNKGDFPQLYDILSGMVSETELTFTLPDFRNRIPMGASDTLVSLDVLETSGTHETTIAEGNLPSHTHTMPSHTHTFEFNHFHVVPSHTHGLSDHTHSTPNHTHSTTIPNHTHAIPTREPGSAFGTGVIAQQSQAVDNSSRTTGSAGGGTFNTASGGGGTTGSGGGGTTAASGTIDTGSAGGTLNTGSSSGTTGSVGSGTPLNILNPVIGIHFFIFAGSSALQGAC